jgi:hypothetical protein
MDVFGSAKWLDIDTVYTDPFLNNYPHVYTKTLTEYQRSNWKPVFEVESCYEGDHNATPGQIRQEAYESILAGGFGENFGNTPLWIFGSGWQPILQSRGSLDMQQLHAIFSPRRWDLLVPDSSNTFLTNGAGLTGFQHVSAARASDGSWGAIYVASGTKTALTVDLSGFSGTMSATWIDPSNGAKSAVTGSPFANKGTASITPPGTNAAADTDWVLVFEP